MVSLGHGHSEENTSKSRVYNGRGNSFDEGMETMEMEYRQDPIWKLCKRHSQRDAKVSR